MHLDSKYSDGSYTRIEELDCNTYSCKKMFDYVALLFFIVFYYLLTD